MNTALKEWASVLTAFEGGVQSLLFRKGGIVEAERGGFQLLHREFLLFPTYEHQHAAYLRPEFEHLYHDGVRLDNIEIRLFGRVEAVLPAPAEPEGMRALREFHIWNDRFVEMRYGYKPELPLHLILVRAYRLAAPASLPERPPYAGCKSWVNLTEEIDIDSVTPVLSDSAFSDLRRRIELG